MAIWTIPLPASCGEAQGWGGQKGMGRWAVPAPFHINGLERDSRPPRQTIQVLSVITST